MASNTRTLQDSINWAKFFAGQRPLNLVALLEPALTCANTIVQIMLQPPFRWRWNRANTSFPITSAAQDYARPLPDFGFIEKAFVTDGTGKIYEVPEIKQELTQDQGTGRPSAIAPYLDDNQGNITFRIMPGIVDQNYTMNVIYQKQPVLFTSLNGLWPIPDRYGLVYQQGFLGMVWLFSDDVRSAFMLQRFTASLLAISEGLTEQERNAFLDQWKFTIESQRVAAKSGQGLTARSAS